MLLSKIDLENILTRSIKTTMKKYYYITFFLLDVGVFQPAQWGLVCFQCIAMIHGNPQTQNYFYIITFNWGNWSHVEGRGRGVGAGGEVVKGEGAEV